jgi:hypothetical protein
MARPSEPPDSLTPPSEYIRPIDPDATDRQRYEAESPRLRFVGGHVADRYLVVEWPRRRVDVFTFGLTCCRLSWLGCRLSWLGLS